MRMWIRRSRIRSSSDLNGQGSSLPKGNGTNSEVKEMLSWAGNPTKEKFTPHFTGVTRLVRKAGFLADVCIELITKSNTCMTNNPIIGPSLGAVMGAVLTDVTGVLSNPWGVTTAELTHKNRWDSLLKHPSCWCVSRLGSSSILNVFFARLEGLS